MAAFFAAASASQFAIPLGPRGSQGRKLAEANMKLWMSRIGYYSLKTARNAGFRVDDATDGDCGWPFEGSLCTRVIAALNDGRFDRQAVQDMMLLTACTNSGNLGGEMQPKRNKSQGNIHKLQRAVNDAVRKDPTLRWRLAPVSVVWLWASCTGRDVWDTVYVAQVSHSVDTPQQQAELQQAQARYEGALQHLQTQVQHVAQLTPTPVNGVLNYVLAYLGLPRAPALAPAPAPAPALAPVPTPAAAFHAGPALGSAMNPIPIDDPEPVTTWAPNPVTTWAPNPVTPWAPKPVTPWVFGPVTPWDPELFAAPVPTRFPAPASCAAAPVPAPAPELSRAMTPAAFFNPLAAPVTRSAPAPSTVPVPHPAPEPCRAVTPALFVEPLAAPATGPVPAPSAALVPHPAPEPSRAVTPPPYFDPLAAPATSPARAPCAAAAADAHMADTGMGAEDDLFGEDGSPGDSSPEDRPLFGEVRPFFGEGAFRDAPLGLGGPLFGEDASADSSPGGGPPIVEEGFVDRFVTMGELMEWQPSEAMPDPEPEPEPQPQDEPHVSPDSEPEINESLPEGFSQLGNRSAVLYAPDEDLLGSPDFSFGDI